jgi:prepilin-type N-terminal cleavage/methylation domain-containing protein
MKKAAVGFSLLELMFTIVLLGILARFAIAKVKSPSQLTIQAQAHSLADVVRRAQSLAVVKQQRQRVRVTPIALPSGATIQVVDADCGSSAPCATDQRYFPEQQTAVAVNASALYFDSLGRPVSSGSGGTPLTTPFCIRLSDAVASSALAFNIRVAPLTGQVSVVTTVSPFACT